MCAMMPMLRVRSSGYCRSIDLFPTLLLDRRRCRYPRRGHADGVEAGAGPDRYELPAVVRERLVGLGHAVSVLALLHGRPTVVRRVEELRRQPLVHGLLRARPGESDEPTHGQGGPALGPDLDRHLVRGAPHPAGLHLEGWLDVVHRLLEQL